MDRTHVDLNQYSSGELDGSTIRDGLPSYGEYQPARLPYLLASSHLLVDDEIDAGQSGAHTYRSSIASRRRRQQKQKAWKMSSHIQLGLRGPRVEK